MATQPISLFTGDRATPMSDAERQLPYITPEDRKDPTKYKTEPDLVAAVNVAMTLGMPLLITGEPGCGKSQLAYRVAWELGFGESVEVNGETHFQANVEKFAVKSTTESGDLFYTFDTIGRFHASGGAGVNKQIPVQEQDSNDASDPRNFIHYQALGKAILRGLGQEHVPQAIISKQQWLSLNAAPSRSIVLIDEIDKAPRDVPNDILNEIDDMAFSIPELQHEQPVTLPTHLQQNRPIVIITSNSERDLPEAFLRRCVFYHLSFPKFQRELASNQQGGSANGQGKGESDAGQITVEAILASQFPEYFSDAPLRTSAVNLMQSLRQQADSYHKAPSMAEFINCFDFLFKYCNQQRLSVNSQQALQSHFSSSPQRRVLLSAINQTLFKNHDDMQLAQSNVQQWLGSF